MIKIIKEETSFENYFIKDMGNRGKVLCVRYRKRTDDYSLSWVNSSWIVDNCVLRFKSQEDAEQFIDDNPRLFELDWFPEQREQLKIGRSRNAFELVPVNLFSNGEHNLTSNIPTYVSKIYYDRNVNKYRESE